MKLANEFQKTDPSLTFKGIPMQPVDTFNGMPIEYNPWAPTVVVVQGVIRARSLVQLEEHLAWLQRQVELGRPVNG